MKLNGAQLIIRLLERQGITCIAGIPGGANLPLYDALTASPIKHVLTRHEQGAGFIAQGMARASGDPAVCFASSGPGATNLVTAIADAHMDSIPLIAITGQVSSALIGSDAFQEVDTFGLMLPITKHNWLVRSVHELLHVIPEAFRIACSGRPGPVAIDIPKDIQLQEIEIDDWPDVGQPDAQPVVEPRQIERMHAMISQAQRPVLMIGGGVIHSGCYAELRTFAERLQLPTVSTLMGLGAMPGEHPLFLGMLGMHGARATNMVLAECDLLIGVGVRFDDRATGKASTFCENASIIHVDIDAGEHGKIITPQLAIQADIGSVLRASLQGDQQAVARAAWHERIAFLKQRFNFSAHAEQDLFRPYPLLMKLADLIDDDASIVTDVGQHQMWTAQYFPLQRSRQWFTSGGLGTMGFALPTAIGVALSETHGKVLCISGDGSIMMNIQELATAVEHDLNIKIIIMNNQHLGLVRQQQALFYGARFCAINNQRNTDFSALAIAMGAQGYDLAQARDPAATLEQALSMQGPCVINVPICEQEMVLPMVPPNAANSEMIGD